MDDIGHGIRSGNTPRIQKQRGSSQGSIQSLGGMSTNSSMVGPAPTTKPPTPPQVTRTGSKGYFCLPFVHRATGGIWEKRDFIKAITFFLNQLMQTANIFIEKKYVKHMPSFMKIYVTTQSTNCTPSTFICFLISFLYLG